MNIIRVSSKSLCGVIMVEIYFSFQADTEGPQAISATRFGISDAASMVHDNSGRNRISGSPSAIQEREIFPLCSV